ncbi:TonB-dependent receptor [Ferrimonas balearica]|uniref:TonB-dependent receptor domain-containing protein n=1 Tax=Ferrimonas balearica TaxID=44012 RepID=UPI001C56C053|nr:TonB-dependent receptor [Ferrimonas balearica]MBW3138565.1 TonB-dependent receptor [Ferrimonas balearica]MBY6105626.1 TonB-dependent receptor [Ferrimonas balearica]
MSAYKLSLAPISALSLWFTPVVAASEPPNETMVVTASGFEQDVTQAPATISVIGREQFENRAYQDITDVLKDVPGVVVTGGGSRQDISLRGMPAQYTAILVDGRKQSGRESQPNGSGGFEQDWLPPLDAIERIEVVRGPMSTLYGSDAIGGVINIITRKDYDQWQGNLRVEATLQENADSGNLYQGQLRASGPLIEGLLSASLYGTYQERKEDDIERGYSGKVLNNYRGSAYLTPSEQDTFTLEFAHQDQTRESTAGLSLPDRNDSSQTENRHQSWSLAHEGRYDSVMGQSYLQQESTENLGRDITITNFTANSQWTLPLDAHYLSLGVTWLRSELEDHSTNINGSQTEISNDQWSLFAEDEWLMLDNFALTVGVRVDDNEQFDLHVSPRIYGVWSLNHAWTLKGGVSTGYRAPELREMAPGWVQESSGGDIYGNPELKPEVSLNKEISLLYAGERGLQSSVTLFHNDFEDKVTLVSCDAERCGGDPDARQNINIDEAVIYGAEAALAVDLLDNLSLSASYTFTESEQRSGEFEGRPLTQIPRHVFSTNLQWRPTETLGAWGRVNFRGEESQPVNDSRRAIVAPSYGVLDIGGDWQVTSRVKLMLGIYNLTDKAIDYDNYGYVADGRRYWLAVNTEF